MAFQAMNGARHAERDGYFAAQHLLTAVGLLLCVKDFDRPASAGRGPQPSLGEPCSDEVGERGLGLVGGLVAPRGAHQLSDSDLPA
jgi:hypothetical protein